MSALADGVAAVALIGVAVGLILAPAYLWALWLKWLTDEDRRR